jgi:triacylglycerol lipase
LSNGQKFIVLAHGIARFDILSETLRRELKLPDDEFTDRFQYFKGVKTHLEAHGFMVSHPNQDFAGPVDLRAEQLRDRVNEITSGGVNKVHIIAHSMGGLDARHMIVDKGMAERVASLTTIGTPHLGTVLARHVHTLGGIFVREILRPFVNVDGFADLTIEACQQFNNRAEDQEARNGVFYQTYASSETHDSVFAPLRGSWDFIRNSEGRNDGLVPFDSMQWKKELVASDGTRKSIVQKEFPFPADRLNQVGWWDPQEITHLTLDISSILKQRADYESKVRDVYLDIAQHLP